MGSISRSQDLKVWQDAPQLVLAVYREIGFFPAEERYGVTSQMRRAAISVPANIAEGFKRRGENEKMRFYNISEASLEELKCYFILSQDLGYTSDTQQLMEDADTVSRMLHGLIQSIERRR